MKEEKLILSSKLDETTHKISAAEGPLSWGSAATTSR
jgi:hypothetical protein